MKISVVMAAHNEEKYLPYALGSLVGAPVDELVVCLDRCSDRSLEIIKNAPLNCEKKIIDLGAKSWRNPSAEPFAVAAKAATGDVTYVLGADIYADKEIFNVNWEGVYVRSWGLRSYPLLDSENFFATCARDMVSSFWDTMRCRMKGLHYATGIYAYRKEVYRVVQHEDVDSEDYLFVLKCQQKGFNFKFKGSCCLHLRPFGVRNMRFKAETPRLTVCLCGRRFGCRLSS